MQWINAIHLISTGIFLALVGMLFAAVVLHTKKQVHRIAILATLPAPVQDTAFYSTAKDYIQRRVPPRTHAGLIGARTIAMWFLFFVVACGALITCYGGEWIKDTSTPNFLLGGGLAADYPAKHADPAEIAKLQDYQATTVFTMVMAFIGAYIWTVSTLLTRQANDDVTPATYFSLTLRIITALLMACVVRHLVNILPLADTMENQGGNGPMGLAVLGFMIGWSPTLFIDETLSWGYQKLGIGDGRQKSPNPDNLPGNLSLTLIQGLTGERIERVNEIDVDNAQKLATENPILLWLKLPYNMDLIMDWVAQAQLCILFEDNLTKALRAAGLRDIFTFVAAAKDPQSAAGVQKILNVDAEVITTSLAALDLNPSYLKLVELRAAMAKSVANPAAG